MGVGRLKLITFDLDNTLWPVTEVIEAAERELAKFLMDEFAHAGPHLAPEQLRAIREELLTEQPELAVNLTELRKQGLVRAFQRAGMRSTEARAAAEASFEVFAEHRNRVPLFEGVAAALRELSGRFMLGALTNGNADIVRAGLGDFFEFQYTAEAVGSRKPAPDLFERALRHAGVTAKEALHVGDHPSEDVRAAESYGWRAIWANPLGVDWPEEEPPPRHSFVEFAELPALVGRIQGVGD